MIQPSHPAQAFAHRLRVVLAVVGLVAIGFGIAVLSVNVSRQINLQSSASSDNVQWALAQLDVELQTLTLALDDAIQTPTDLSQIRTRFDVFYSRLDTLQVGSLFAELRQNPAFTASFDRLKGFAAKTAAQMDGPDADLVKALPDLGRKTRDLLADAHLIALKGVASFAQLSDVRRAAVESTLIELAGMTMVLVAILVAMLLRVLRLDRVNQLKAAENAETLTRLDAVVATSLDSVITLNDEGLITEFNQAAVHTFGHGRDEAVGQPLTLLIPPNAEGRSQLPPRSQRLDASQRRRRVTARHRDGHDFPAEVSLASSQVGAGWVHVVFLRDLSQQLAAEQALVTARDEALAGEKAKADLLVVMSHEIRTPLNGMIGTMELLDSTALAPHQREYLRIMAASGRLLMHHVNDVLDIARLDSGKAALNLAPVDLSDLVREVIENQTPTSLANGNALTFTPSDDDRHLVLADAAMLRQVLMNLVGNAVKFTHAGLVTVEVTQRSPQGPTEIAVHDTGVGIPPEDRARIFEDFVTLDASYARRAAGTGLGLGIVRRVVTRMGGKITVESEAGQGSTFRVFLPLTRLDDDALLPDRASGPAKVSGLSVLVVEDNDFNRLIVRDMLLAEDHSVTEARDGLEGVRLAEGQRFDLIFMDISMPGIDGLQAAKRIRTGHGASRSTPIVALTAHALPEEAERFRAGGMTQVLIKPITRDTLAAVLAGLPDLGLAKPSDAMPSEPPDDGSDEGLVDMSVLAQLRDSLGAAKTDKLIGKFLLDTDKRIHDLTERVRASASDADLASEVHRLNGTAAMFGAALLHTQLSMMEDLCDQRKTDQARAEVPNMIALWHRTTQAYRRIGSLDQASSLR